MDAMKAVASSRSWSERLDVVVPERHEPRSLRQVHIAAFLVFALLQIADDAPYPPLELTGGGMRGGFAVANLGLGVWGASRQR